MTAHRHWHFEACFSVYALFPFPRFSLAGRHMELRFIFLYACVSSCIMEGCTRAQDLLGASSCFNSHKLFTMSYPIRFSDRLYGYWKMWTCRTGPLTSTYPRLNYLIRFPHTHGSCALLVGSIEDKTRMRIVDTQATVHSCRAHHPPSLSAA